MKRIAIVSLLLALTAACQQSPTTTLSRAEEGTSHQYVLAIEGMT